MILCKKTLHDWKRWFAWYPQVIGFTKDGIEIKVWLEFIERKYLYTSWYPDTAFKNYLYRHPKTPDIIIKNDKLYITKED